MKRILVIGIGAGDPDHLTVQAIAALNRADVFFVMDKSPAKDALVALRREICRRHVKDRPYRFVDAEQPGRSVPAAGYRAGVLEQHRAKQAIWERLFAEELKEGECGAFLVWGDPALYDSTIRILRAIVAKGVAIDYEVIPGISSLQVLAARHRIPLNRIGEPVTITTGRKLAQGFPEGADSVVVMLDGEEAYLRYADQDMEIFWGAYLGMPHEILIAGPLRDVAGEIHRRRAEARAAHGWMFDIYLLRRRVPGEI